MLQIYLCIVLLIIGSVYGSPSCKTPEKEDGQCISIFECDPLAKLVKSNLTTDDITYLRNSTCGFKDKTPQVCCPTTALHKSSSPSSRCSMTVSPLESECCGMSSNPHNTLGGFNPQIDTFPWLALVEYKKGNKILLSKCGGVLISGKYVLTSANCVRDGLDIGQPLNIRLGEYDISNDGKDCEETIADDDDCTDGHVSIPIEKIIVHDDFNVTSKMNDIALVKLKNYAPYTDFIRPICLPSSNIETKETAPYQLIIAGWSSREYGQKTYKRLYSNIPMTKLEQCKAALSISELTKSQLCAGDKDQNTCRADYGGPLMFENGSFYEVSGILSYGPKTCTSDKPTVFTNVFEYKDWIVSHTKE